MSSRCGATFPRWRRTDCSLMPLRPHILEYVEPDPDAVIWATGGLLRSSNFRQATKWTKTGTRMARGTEHLRKRRRPRRRDYPSDLGGSVFERMIGIEAEVTARARS